MPELPEVETVCQGLARAIGGKRISSVTLNRRNLRRPIPKDFKKTLTGRRILSIRRRAKYIIMDLEGKTSAVWHLGMSGRMTVSDTAPAPEKHDHIVFRAGTKTVVFNDPRRFGLVTLDRTQDLGRNKLFAHLGPEPLENKFTAAYLQAHFKTRKIAVKLAIMDQKTVVGVGNIYASEALFCAGIDPQRPANSLTPQETSRLCRAIRTVLRAAIRAGGSSLRDYVQASGELGYFQHKWAVYDKNGKACPGCTCVPEKTGGIQRIVQGGRATFYCPLRQR